MSTERLTEEAISLYQSASALYTEGLLVDEGANKQQPKPARAAWQPKSGPPR
jgi:hypothetical protein